MRWDKYSIMDTIQLITKQILNGLERQLKRPTPLKQAGGGRQFVLVTI